MNRRETPTARSGPSHVPSLSPPGHRVAAGTARGRTGACGACGTREAGKRAVKGTCEGPSGHTVSHFVSPVVSLVPSLVTSLRSLGSSLHSVPEPVGCRERSGKGRAEGQGETRQKEPGRQRLANRKTPYVPGSFSLGPSRLVSRVPRPSVALRKRLLSTLPYLVSRSFCRSLARASLTPLPAERNPRNEGGGNRKVSETRETKGGAGRFPAYDVRK